MSEKTVKIVVTAVPNPEAMEDMQTYLSKVVPILVGYGGEIIVRGKANKAVVGNINFGMILVMNYDSAETIEKMFNSPEYIELIPFRDKGFKKFDVVIIENM